MSRQAGMQAGDVLHVLVNIREKAHAHFVQWRMESEGVPFRV